MRLEALLPDARISGVLPDQTVTVVAVAWHGDDALTLTFRTISGEVADQVFYRADEDDLSAVAESRRPFDADGAEFRLAAEAQRIHLAGLYDPMLAVSSSDVRPLPHQIRAVYGELLPRTPLRFLLADDPGAGKTIMAGLYVKELLLRGDVHRCLIVAPGGLVDQWQDELLMKFGLRFEILTNQMIDSTIGGSAFDYHPLLIARMDQLARNEILLDQLEESEWDLVVVDEAHRMGAHYYGNEMKKTKRFELGELLGDISRHLLLMTATPHAGKEEDFQLFLTLLDRDRFEGKYKQGVHSADTRGLMRRMIKEDLLTFEGKPLFPERVAETVPYELSPLETNLYEEVTQYVREEMNRAEKLDPKRRNNVGFALTILQRRLASSPEAIYQSLNRRAERLKKRKAEVLDPSIATVRDASLSYDVELLDDDEELSADEIEQLEEELVDSASSARTVEELEYEIKVLAGLQDLAKQVRDAGTDKKWGELRTILEHEALAPDRNGNPRKLIVFTEHRDTLEYLVRNIRMLLGKHQAVETIHGGVSRIERRRITEEFTKNPECQVLVATDAAGEGLNLQAAHLMVNYDLPWNPNRLEQRFGRIHRIGQEEVCRLWNLVASNTREGEVFTRLLEKVEEQRKAYGGKVFDVLGEAFENRPLRDLLIEAIRYGEQPEVRAAMHKTIDSTVSEGLKELLDERALSAETMQAADVEALKGAMDEARARRLQPHYIELFFREAFKRLGGRLSKREAKRFEITNVPAALRDTRTLTPIATKYERVTFEMDSVALADQGRADLIAPGHPLHDIVVGASIHRWGSSLTRGVVLIDPNVEQARMLVGVVEELNDGTGTSTAKRFSYAYVEQDGTVSEAGPAPYLDFVSAPESSHLDAIRTADWVAGSEKRALSWIIANRLPEFLRETSLRREVEIGRTSEAVKQRLSQEINRLYTESMAASDKEQHGLKPKRSAESLNRNAAELEVRLERRTAELQQQSRLRSKPPLIVTAALIVPLSLLEGEAPREVAKHAKETKAVERRAVAAVLAAERGLGRHPEEQAFNNPGFDILSRVDGGDPIRVEVKGRIEGAEDFSVTYNEILYGKNAAPRYRLALVRVDQRGPEHDEIRYLNDPFAAIEIGGLLATGVRFDWAKAWAQGSHAN